MLRMPSANISKSKKIIILVCVLAVILLLLKSTFFNEEGGLNFFVDVDQNKNGDTSTTTTCVSQDIAIKDGDSRIFYTKHTVQSNQSCDLFSQTRTCTQGVLSGDTSYTYSTCSADAISNTELLSPKGEDTSIISLADGSLLMMRAAEKEVKPAFRGGRLWMLKSTDNGKTWKTLTGGEAIPYVATNAVGYAINGPSMQLLESGRILVAYHLWTNYIPQKYSTHSVEMIFSDDRGLTWKHLSTVDKIKVPNGTLGFGLWEPFIETPKLRPGVVQVYYASERDDSVSCPNDPNHPSGVKKGQDISMKESIDYGKTWGSTHVVLRNGKSREGVPTIAESPDGALFLAHEHLRFPLCTDTRPQSGFLPSMAMSKDGGMTWTDLGPIYYPSSDFVGSGWPHIIRLTDGRLAIRFATEITPGEDSPRKVNLLVTINIPSMTTMPVWEKTPTVIMGNDLQWGTIFQAANNDLIVTGGQLNMLQYYRVFPLRILPQMGQ